MKFFGVSSSLLFVFVLALALAGCCGGASTPTGGGEEAEAPPEPEVEEEVVEAEVESKGKKPAVKGPVALSALNPTDLQELLRRKRWVVIGDPSTSEDRDIRGVSFVVRQGTAKGTVALYTYKSVALAKVFATNLERNNTAVRRDRGKVLAVRIEGDPSGSKELLNLLTVSP